MAFGVGVEEWRECCDGVWEGRFDVANAQVASKTDLGDGECFGDATSCGVDLCERSAQGESLSQHGG